MPNISNVFLDDLHESDPESHHMNDAEFKEGIEYQG